MPFMGNWCDIGAESGKRHQSKIDSSRLYLLYNQKSKSGDGLSLRNGIPASTCTSFGLCAKKYKKRGQKMMKNTFNYILKGDYYIPDITLPECPKPVGRWGRLYQNFLKNYHPVSYPDGQ